MPIRLLQRYINSAEFAELWADELTNPRGTYRDDLRMGTIAAQIYNANRGKEQQAAKAEDYLLKFKRPGEVSEKYECKQQSQEVQIAIVRAINRAMGGIERQRGDDSKPGSKADR